MDDRMEAGQEEYRKDMRNTGQEEYRTGEMHRKEIKQDRRDEEVLYVFLPVRPYRFIRLEI